jgi:hypothetical protein
MESGLAFVDTEDWKATDDVLRTGGPMPSDPVQIMSDIQYPREYPKFNKQPAALRR